MQLFFISFRNLEDHYKKINITSDFLNKKILQEQSEGYMRWLESWDSFLVNWVDRELVYSDGLKNLVRTGVPPAYRTRVWKRFEELCFFWSPLFTDESFFLFLSVNKETNFLIKENIASLKSFIILKSPRSYFSSLYCCL